jgi:hypothetical protein
MEKARMALGLFGWEVLVRVLMAISRPVVEAS